MDNNTPILPLPLDKALAKAQDIRKAAKCRAGFSARSNWASQLGHPCLRYLVNKRVNGEQARPISVNLQYIFDYGKLQEEGAVEDLQEIGLEVIETQMPLEWKKFQIAGRLDCALKIIPHKLPPEIIQQIDPATLEMIKDKKVPGEIKGYASHALEKINSIDDLLLSDKHYHRTVPAQILLYMLMKNEEYGLLIFKDKSTGKLKFIEIYLNSYLDYAESLLKKAELINRTVEAIKAGDSELPAIPENTSICDGCDFEEFCLPDRIGGKPIQFIDDPEIVAKLNRRAELQPAAKEFKELDDELKSRFKDAKVENLIVGDWYINTTERARKAYTVEAGTYIVTEIKPISDTLKAKLGKK